VDVDLPCMAIPTERKNRKNLSVRSVKLADTQLGDRYTWKTIVHTYKLVPVHVYLRLATDGDRTPFSATPISSTLRHTDGCKTVTTNLQ
jgi:hypothetical protein